MKEQIQEMESELERFHKSNVSLELEKTTLNQKLQATKAELQNTRQKVRDCRSVIKTIKIELHKCAGKIQEPAQLKKAVEKLHATFCSTPEGASLAKEISVDTSSAEDKAKQLRSLFQKLFHKLLSTKNILFTKRVVTRQREHLERSLASLRQKMGKDSQAQRQDHVKIMQENVQLIAEINELRRELKTCRVKIGDLETVLGVRKSKKNKNTAEIDILKDHTAELVEQKNTIDELESVIKRQQTQIVNLRS